MLIDCDKKLIEFCKKIENEKYITIDTEFVREKTYFPILCVIQIATKDIAVAIDCLNIDLSPIYKILENKNILKIFHGCEQDLEIFYHKTGKIVSPIFDTQIAASFCGFGEFISYINLVEKITNTRLSKAQQYSQWAKRPLSNEQINYAISDVTYLLDVYEYLKTEIEKKNYQKLLDIEHNKISKIEKYKPDPENIWKKIKLKSQSKNYIGLLYELAKWREKKAIEKDIPRIRITSDNSLNAIALTRPNNIPKIKNIRGVSLNNNLAEEILEIINNAKPASKELMNRFETKYENINIDGSLLQAIKLLLKIKSDEMQISPKIIASDSDIKKIILDQNHISDIDEWQRDVFFNDVIKFINGETSIKYSDSKIKIM